jgi:hypothetical protein
VKVIRSFSKTTSETKVEGNKTITETKTERWGDNTNVADDFWNDIDASLDAVSRAMDKISKQSTVVDEGMKKE